MAKTTPTLDATVCDLLVTARKAAEAMNALGAKPGPLENWERLATACAYLEHAIRKVEGLATPQVTVYVICGSGSYVREVGQEEAIQEFSFATEAELIAFKQGLEAADGYLENHVYDTQAEAAEGFYDLAGSGPDAEDET